MHKAIYTCAACLLAILVTAGCTGIDGDGAMRTQRPKDTLYTGTQAMDVYDYQPGLALSIIDSAVAAGNVSPVMADFLRAKVYAWTFMGAHVDSLLHGPDGVRYDSARVVAERLLGQDMVRDDPSMRQNVLEVLISVARRQKDMPRLLDWSQQLVELCHEQGAETEALRSEAEVGAALYMLGERERGLARLDSVIDQLDNKDVRRFNELDATVIALKRKMVLLSGDGRYVETIPLARSIIERLDDYESHADDYHDGTYREPADSTARADYIEFYRTQAQGAVTVAYAFLGQQGSMSEAYERIESSVREATAREHIARYHALEQQKLRAEAENHSHLMTTVATTSAIGLVIILVFATYIYFQNRRIQEKNRVLVKLVSSRNDPPAGGDTGAPHDAAASGEAHRQHTQAAEADDGMFASIDAAIRSERLYANASIQRQDICERFDIRREALNRLLSDCAGCASFPAYINGIRLSEACRLLKNEPSMTVNAIADEVGLSPRNLRRLFVEQYGITPTEYRHGLKGS